MSFFVRHFRPVFALALAAVASGCSVDMFSPKAGEQPGPVREKYRKIRPECSGLRLESSQLDAPTFRKLIACFNSNGSMPEVAKLVADASDRTLTESTHILNTTFLANPQVLGESREVVRSLKGERRWEESVAQFAPLLQDPERARALIRIFSFGKSEALLQRTIRSFDARETAAGFELLERLTASPAFASLIEKIDADPLTVAERARLVDLVHGFSQKRTPLRSAKDLVEAMANGKSAALWDYAFGEGDAVLAQSDRTFALLREFGKKEGEILRGLSRFHRGFHRPVECWGGGKTFPEPWKNLSEELGLHRGKRFLPFVTRFASLTALGIQDLCQVPEEVLDYFPKVLEMTRGPVGGVYVEVLERIFANELGVPAGYFVGEWGEEVASALALLEGKPWLADLVLVLAELDREDRDRAASWVRVLLLEREEWTSTIEGWERSDLQRFFSDVGILIGKDAAALSRMAGSVRVLFEAGGVHPWFDGWKKVAVDSEEAGLERLMALESFPDASRAISEMAEDGRLAVVLADILEILSGGGRPSVARQKTAEAALKKKLRHTHTGSDLFGKNYSANLDASLLACTSLNLRLTAESQREVFETCLAGGGVTAEELAAIRRAQRADFAPLVGSSAGNGSFLQWFVSSVVRLPLSVAEKRQLVQSFSADSRFSFTEDFLRRNVAKIREFTQGRVFHILGRFQSGLRLELRHWENFFAGVRRALDDRRLSGLAGAFDALERTAPGGARIGPASRPPSATLRAWVSELECVRGESAVARRAEVVENEFDDAVLGWERPGGTLPLRWEASDLKPRLASFVETLGAPSVRRGLYGWLAGLDPQTAARWFHARGSDPKLVAVMDPVSRQIRVRWMTTLDRLESILVNANFSYLLPTNYGLKFIERFAEAWGDEPREKWPREIQERYRGRKRPPTLRDVYDEVQDTIRWFERIGGIPGAPECVNERGTVARSAIRHSWGTAPDLLIPFEVKAKAFNLRQTIDVIAENLPGSGAKNAEGMRLLRDLFWAANSAVPYDDRDPSDPDGNPLRFFLELGDLGGLRTVSRGVQEMEFVSEIHALADVFASLRLLVREPALDRILARITAKPAALGAWVDAVYLAEESEPAFGWSVFATSLMNALAADRVLSALPISARFADSILSRNGDAWLPHSLIGEAILASGRGGVSDSRLTSFAPPPREVSVRLAEFPAFLEQRVFAALRALPLAEGVQFLDRDPVLRKELRNEYSRLQRSRQRDGVKSDDPEHATRPLGREFFAPEGVEFRRAVGLWCGTSAPRAVFEFARRPDEASLIVDGLLQSADSAAAFDFLEALFRQLPR